MNYEQAEKYIHDKHNFSANPGLSRMSELCQKLGDPQSGLKFVHVAGTNGKGSTVTMIACALEDAGYTVGKYTSPYVFNFRERIEVCGKMISETELADITETVKCACNGMHEKPTEFELITAIAFVYFKLKKCDYVVLEVGLGGRFDATNIIKAPLVSVICSISLDHTQILGSTIEEITLEKAGIIKEGQPCVLYPKNSETVKKQIGMVCADKNAPLYLPDFKKLHIENTENENAFEYEENRYTMRLFGKHQIYNAITAITALKLLGTDIKYILSGIARAYLHGRYEVISQKPRVILDAGHNQGGISCLVDTIKQDKNIKELTVIFGMLRDKDYRYAIGAIAPLAKRMICISPDSPRALTADEMKEVAKKYCLQSYAASSMREAAELALSDSDDKTILICGSFYIMDKAVKELL